MIIELKEAAQQALSALEKSQPHPSNPVIGLTNQDFIDHEETIRQLRAALSQQPDTPGAFVVEIYDPIRDEWTLAHSSPFWTQAEAQHAATCINRRTRVRPFDQQPAEGVVPVGYAVDHEWANFTDEGAHVASTVTIYKERRPRYANVAIFTTPPAQPIAPPSVPGDVVRDAVEELHKLNEYAIVYIDDPEWTRVSDTCQKLIGSIGAAMLHNP